MIRLRSIGQCVVEVGDTKLTPKAETIFAVALYIVLEGGRPISRRELKEVLWPGATEQRANHCLRQALYKLNALGAALRCERTHVVLPQRSLHSDCAPLLTVQNAAELERLADGITGPFLPGYAPAFSAPFSEWLERKRDHVSAALRRVLVSGIAAKRARGEWSRAESLAATCLGIDSLNEEATLAVAEAAAMQGSKVRALAILDRYLEEIGSDSAEIRSPALALRRRIAEPGPREPMPVRRTPHVGREGEVAELMRLLQRAAAAQGSIAVVWGEPGIGKTRLATEVSRAAALQRVQVATMGCQAHDERRPLSAFMDLVPKLLELRGALGSSPDSIKYLKRLIAHDPAETTLSPDSRESELLFALIRRALFDLLDAVAAEARLLVIIEDVHWLDAASWELLRDLGPWVQSRQLVIVLTSRREEVVERLAGPEHPAPVAVHVTPLRESAMLELWRNITAGTDRERDEEFRDWCVSSAGGNPYYLMELALHSSRVTGAYRAPVELEKLIATRLQALSPVALRVFQSCALLGKLSTLDRIEQVLAERRVDLVSALDELERRGFIESDGTRVSIKHDILGVTAVRMLSQTSLTLLHRHAAMVLEREMEGSKSTEVLWECAEHWRHVGEREHALELLRTCARHALEIGVPGEAVRLLEHAETLDTGKVQRLSVLQDLSIALQLTGQWDALLSNLERVRRLQTQLNPNRSTHDSDELLAVEAKWRTSTPPIGLIESLARCAASVDAPAQHRLSAAIFGVILADNLVSVEHAHVFRQHVLQLIESKSIPSAMRDSFLLIYNCGFGELSAAIAAAQSLVEGARATGSSAALSRSLSHASVVYEVGGMIDAAKAAAREAFQIAEHLQLAGHAASAASRMTKVHLQVNDIGSAEMWNAQAMHWVGRCSPGIHVAHIYVDQAHIACLHGAYKEADRLLRVCEKWAPRSALRQQAYVLAVRTLVSMRSRGKAPSNGLIDRLFELHQRMKATYDHDLFVAVLAEACRAANRSDEFWAVFVPFVTQTRRDRSPLLEPLRQIALSGGLPLPQHLT